MSEELQELARRLVVGRKRDGRSVYDEAAKAELVGERRTNPFLHLAMHLTISEQCSIDQPSGIRQAVELLATRRQSLHEAHHAAKDCLGEMIWASQRSGLPPDGHAYLDCVRRRATAG